MKIIRDDILSGILLIPILTQYKINRCNIKKCYEKPTTICVHDLAIFGLCEKHYKKFKKIGNVKLNLEFD